MKDARLTIAIGGTVTSTGGDLNDGILYLKGRTKVSVIIPALDAATIGLQVSNDPDKGSAATWLTLQKSDLSGDLLTASITTTGKAVQFYPVPFKAIKILASAAQSSLARTFIVGAEE